MSAVRILILGILNDKKSCHGYEVRQILESWNIEKWANVGYGSIYFALKKMAEEGLIEVVEGADNKAEKIVYQITPEGSSTFLKLLRKQWLELKPAIDPFQVALTFMNYLDRDELLALLEHRAETWRFVIKSADKVLPIAMKDVKLPQHIDENHRLIIDHYKTELNWIDNTIEKVKQNELP